MINHMDPGDEAKHVQCLLRHFHYRGIDIRLSTSDLYDPIPIRVPYLAFRWHWETLLSFPWKNIQHINILELQVLLAAVRRMVATNTSGCRYFYLVDSMVTTNVVSKRRFTRKRLNRLTRKLMATMIARDTYPIILWTISKRNFSAAASRAHERRPAIEEFDL